MKKILRKKFGSLDKIKKSLNVLTVYNDVKQMKQEAVDFKRKTANNFSLAKSYALHPLQPFALVFNVAPWKRSYVRNYLYEYKVIFVGLSHELERYESLANIANVVIIVWGRSVLAHIKDFSLKFNLQIYHIEDGFIRSIGLGASQTAPMSLCFDKTGLYYDAYQPSDLENLLNFYDFDNDKDLTSAAQDLLDKIIKNDITKYNLPDTDMSEKVYGIKTKKRVLVIGQVEDDQSLIYGCRKVFSNFDLLQTVIAENPDAQIIYKRHPDVLFGKRKELSDISGLGDHIEIINGNLSLKDSLNQVDQVYTMTSLAGFEALMHGVKVTTLGAPFYSGWGLTDDRFPISRRQRSLSFLEVFAAAYILYPRYRSVDTLSKSTLSQTIDYMIGHKQTNVFLENNNKFNYLKFYNLQTTHRVDNNLITRLGFNSVVLVSDSLDALNVAESISESSDMKVSLITTRDQLANNELMMSASRINNENKIVAVTSIHKRYSVPLSSIEEESVNISNKLAKELELTLNDLFSDFLTTETLEYLSKGLSDYCYFEILRFLSMRSILDEFDVVIVHLENSVENKDIIDSIQYHAQAKDKKNKVFLSIVDKDVKEVLSNNLNLTNVTLDTSKAENKQTAARFWYDINDSKFHSKILPDDIVLVCGNIVNNNYGYSPATKGVLEVVNKKHSGNIIFFNSSLTSEKLLNEFRKDFLETRLYSTTKVYNLSANNYINKYGENYTKYNKLFSTNIPSVVLEKASASIPIELLNILEKRVSIYCSSLQNMIAMAVDVYKLIDNVSIFYTSMERSTVSKVISAICKEKNVASVGVQPQIISKSKRYSKPVVDKMGVIDESQVTILASMGYDINCIEKIGSINIIDRLKAMESYNEENETYDIFFAMQHSLADLMIQAIEALYSIIQRNNLTLIIKPHPHQELPIYYKLRDRFASLTNVKFLTRESDTYLWLSRSRIIVGMFSSVLLEAACYGKDVIVSSFGQLDDSINMSISGLTLEATTEVELEENILDLLDKKDKWKQLQISRKGYLDRNTQFKPPYTNYIFDRFIESKLPSAKE